MAKASLSYVREHLEEIWDRLEVSRTEIFIHRESHEDMAVLPAAELRSMRETLHLLSTPRNAARLYAALERSRGE